MPTRRSLISFAFVAAVTVLYASTIPSAFAMERPFPPVAKRGTMKPDLFPSIIINGKPRIMSAGARIYNTANLIQMPASLPPKNMVVNYTENSAFEIEKVWILTDDEAAQSPQQQKINPEK